ncbi:MAG: Ig-like domain-containing protein, partial [Thermoplasmata archaeon]
LNTTRWYNFTIDGILPEIALISTDNNSVIKPGVTLILEISDVHPVSVNFSINGTPYAPLLPPYEIDTTVWQDDLYNLSISAVDAAGNENISVFTVIIDSVLPEIPSISPPNGSAIEVGSPINISVIDPNLDIVNYTINGGDNITLPPPFIIDTTDFPDGDVVIVVYISDMAGNINSTEFHFILNDTTKPQIILVSPGNQSHIPKGTVIDLEILDLHFLEASYSLDGGAPIALGGSFDVGTSLWSEGLHTLEVTADDTRHNTNISWFEFTIDSLKPEISLVSPLNNSVVLPGTVLNFAITDVNLEEVQYTVNDEAPVTLDAPHNITASWEDGVYNITVYARDVAGNMNIQLFVITVDSTAPVIALNAPENGSHIPQGTPIDLDISDANPVTVQYSVNGGPLKSLSSPFDINTTGWADGDYLVFVSASDPPGNAAEATYFFILDSTHPAISRIAAALPYFPFNDTVIVIVFTEAMDRGSVEGVLSITPEINYTITWSEDSQTMFLKNISGLQVGQSYTVSVGAGAKDLAGNELSDFPDHTFKATTPPEEKEDEATPWLFWLLVPILVVLLLFTLRFYVLTMREKREEPKGPEEEVQDIYIRMRAQEDLDAMKAILKDHDRLGDRMLEAELMYKKAREAFDAGDYGTITVYERTLRDMVGGDAEEEAGPEVTEEEVPKEQENQ